ncbi:MAG: sugar-transfer associated ATP-grasp domain-containing protein [Eubacteriales bacterium]|nr:sugar-transfer associated ATP-grasp domain-containing protein [Eubacteriales bacterium]
MKRLIYLLYYVKITNWLRLKQHLKFVHSTTGISKSNLIWDMIGCSLKYGTALHEYFYYGFYNKTAQQRSEYASMGFMYEYQKKMNPPSKREILADKNKFDVAYQEFVSRGLLNPETASVNDIVRFINGKQKIVLKRSTGGGGKNVKILSGEEVNAKNIQTQAIAEHYDILEEFVIQHEALQGLSPNSLNTVRFITLLKTDGSVDIIGTSLRMGIYNNTDNLSSGGITCKVNVETGVIESQGYSFDITQSLCDVHPVSGIKLIGFQIPYWKEVKEMCKKAAAKYPDNRCIGWDVAIKQDGPLLIEGNHDWGARVWQMPAGKGMKTLLEKYL